MKIEIIDAEKVRSLLSMKECIECMAEAMAATSAAEVLLPPRFFAKITEGNGSLALMPGGCSNLKSYGVKVISLHPDNPANILPSIQGFVILFDYNNGKPLALIDGAEITAIRTAAASGLATKLLANPFAQRCGILGTGVQARVHIDAMRAVRPVKEILIWGRDQDKSNNFATEQAERTGIDVKAVTKIEEMSSCDLICTVTGSTEPILPGAVVKPGTHVNLVGAHTLDSREADTNLILKSRVFVDLLESAKNEGGDIMIPIEEGVIGEDHIIGEIGEILNGKQIGRTNEHQITVYNSLGIVAQDLFAARHVYDKTIQKQKDVPV